MRKFIFILIIFSFLNIDKVFAAQDKTIIEGADIRYDIDRAELIGGNIILSGWALVHYKEHGRNVNSAYPKYSLILKNTITGSEKGPYSSNWNSSYSSKPPVQKYDLTCTLFTNLGSPIPTCFSILTGTPYLGVSGQAGVDKLFKNTENIVDNSYYRNIGFQFTIPLNELSKQLDDNDCPCNSTKTKKEAKINYNMKIEIQLGPDNVIYRSIPISIVGKNVEEKLIDTLTVQNVPDDVLIEVHQGRVLLNTTDLNRLPFSTAKKNNLGQYYILTSGEYYRVFDIFYNVFDNYAYNKSLDNLYPYKLSYYEIKIKYPKTGIQVTRGDETSAYVPATWVVPASKGMDPTQISVPCTCKNVPEPDEPEEPEEPDVPIDPNALSCKPYPGPIDFEGKEKDWLDNSACNIKCTETATVTLPMRPTSAMRAGTGFEYNTNIETQLLCKPKVYKPFDEDYYKNLITLAEEALTTAEEDVTTAEETLDAATTAEEEARDAWESASDDEEDAAKATLDAAKATLDAAIKALLDAEITRDLAEKAVEKAKEDYTNAEARYNRDTKTCNAWTTDRNYNLTPSLITSVQGKDYGAQTIIMQRTNTTKTSKDILQTNYKFTYKFPYIYVEKNNGTISRVAGVNYYDGGYKFYTDLKAITGKNYNLDMEVTAFTTNEDWNIKYDCDYDVFNYFPVDNKPLYMFRPISLKNPFPGRSPGANWSGYQNYDFTKKNGRLLYDDNNIIYTISLTPERMKSIKLYNRDYSYVENVLVNGKNAFVNKTFKYLFQPGRGLR